MKNSATLMLAFIALLTGLIAEEEQRIVAIAPAPEVPYILLTTDKHKISTGETIEFVVTFANPTEEKVLLPQAAISGKEGISSISYRLIITWNGSTSPINAVSIDSSPPNFQYLNPGETKTYRFQWTSTYNGKGIADMKFAFGSADTFPPVSIAIQTE